MKKFFTPIKVGILALAAIGGFVFALRSVEKGAFGKSDTYSVFAILEDVLGVSKRSRVVMAGIEVGYIESVELSGERARMNLRIRKDVPLYQDAAIAKISESLLGDKLITLTPGHDVEHPLKDGGEIKNVQEEKDITQLMRELGMITMDIKSITESLRQAIGDMNSDDSMGGILRRMNEISKNVAELTSNLNDTFQRGSLKVEQILDDVAGVTAGTRGRYEAILDNIEAVSKDMRVLLANLNSIVGRGEEDFKEGVGGFKDTLENANRTLENLDSITRKINEGQGTLGRLVNDDKVLQKAEGVLDDAASFTRPMARLKFVIDLRSEYHVKKNAAKNYLALKLVPKSDKYYMIEVIDDPRGSVNVVDKIICETTSAGTESCHTSSETTVEDAFKFSVQFAKRFYWLGLRFGIMEGTGGVGMNWYFFEDDLEFRFDLFQFGKNEWGKAANPRLKAMVMYSPSWLARNIYFAAGADDFFNEASFDYFFGAGIHFDDEDLKSIFATSGVPSIP